MNPESEALGAVARTQVRDALAQLPEEQRELLVRCYFHGHSHREIAERLQMPVGTTKAGIRNGLKKLRSLLDERGETQSWMASASNGHVHELLPDYVTGDAAAAERRRVEEHIRECEECARELHAPEDSFSMIGAAAAASLFAPRRTALGHRGDRPACSLRASECLADLSRESRRAL